MRLEQTSRKILTVTIIIAIWMTSAVLSQTTVYVDGSVEIPDEDRDGTLAAPFKTIDEALVSPDRTILIAGGIYADEPNANSILGGQKIIGGYDSSFTTCDPQATPTIIDMGAVPLEDHGGVFIANNVTGWSIENLIIQNSSTGTGGDTNHGGAVYILNGSGTFRNVTFFKCRADYEDGESGAARGGGAVAIRNDAEVVFEDCVFNGCTAAGGGGAVFYHSGENIGTFNRCLFLNCGSITGASALHDGGANSQIEILSCVFADNGVDFVTPDGDYYPSLRLLSIASQQALIYNCTFIGNTCPEGTLFDLRNSEGVGIKEIINCIFAETSIDNGSGSALFHYADTDDENPYNDNTVFENNLFFSNSGLEPLDPSGDDILSVNDNIAADPQFTDAANGEYHLLADSVAIDAGQTLLLVEDDFTDKARPVGAAYDIGAYEGPLPSLYPVRNIVAQASSSYVGKDWTAQRLVDDSGLNEFDQHDTAADHMWISDLGETAPVLQFEFDGVHQLQEVKVWNSNNTHEEDLGWGVKTATMEYSVDNVNWTTVADVPEFSQATSSDDYESDITVDFGGVDVKYVRITCTSNWGGSRFSLSEVQFMYIPVLPLLLVDNFSRYGHAEDKIWYTWADGYGYTGYSGNGTGSLVDWNVTWDRACMQLDYDNTSSPRYSDVTKTIEADVTGAKSLSLSFQGKAGNTGTFYVKIDGTRVEDCPGDITLDQWQVWHVDLSSQDLSGLSTLSFGVTGGSTGQILIDDVGLYIETVQELNQ